MRGIYLTTSYLVVHVSDSEIANPLTDKIIFMGLNHKKDNEAKERERDKYEIISNFTITSTSFQGNCEINIVKVIDIQIRKSNLYRTRLNINIHQSKIGLNDGEEKTTSATSVHLILGETLFEEFTANMKNIERIKIQNCAFQNNKEEIILVGELTNDNCSAILENNKITSTSIKVHNFMQLKLLGSNFNMSSVSLKNISPRKVCSIQSTISQNNFLATDVSISKVRQLRIIYCNFTDTYLKLGYKDEIQAGNTDVITLPLNTELGIIDSLFQDINTSSECIAKRPDSFISLKQVKLKIERSNFRMFCVIPGGFIEWKNIFEAAVKDKTELSLINTSFNAFGIKPTVPILTFPHEYHRSKINVSNVNFLCSFNVGFDWLDVRSILQCKSYCEQGQYSINSTTPTVAFVKDSLNAFSPNKSSACPTCPTGSSCDKNNIRALPDYWGYKNTNGEVKMSRCPNDYCCSGNDDCKDIDSCKTDRMGKLCGQCKVNMTESLFSANCVSINNCQTILVSAAYVLAAMTYAIFLLTYNDIKDIFLNKMKALSKYFKRIRKRSKTQKTLKQFLNEQKRTNLPQELSMLVDSLLLHNYCMSSETILRTRNVVFDISESKQNNTHGGKSEKQIRSLKIFFRLNDNDTKLKENGNENELLKNIKNLTVA